MSDSTEKPGPRSIRLPDVAGASSPAPRLRLVSRVRHERRLAARDRAFAQVERRAALRERRRAQDYVRLAERDDLTGVLLRGPGLVALGQAVDAARETSAPLALAFLDVDRLKAVNDRGGHGAGDALLRAVGAALREALPASAIIVRMGGDEFVWAISPGTTAQARQHVADVSALLTAAAPDSSLSVGLASLGAMDTCESLIARADGHMYEARRRLRESGTSEHN